VALEHLSQVLDHLDPAQRVLDSVEGIKRVTRTASGEITASSMLERFGFTGDRLTARIGDLSGGERRRLQMLRLLLTEPNVLLLDEPTNDLDIETLTVLEDFLDGWPGTLVVVSHDRYFLERVTDATYALLGDGQVSLLPRGVEEYLERREAALHLGPPAEASRSAVPARAEASRPANPPAGEASRPAPSSGEIREARKAVARVERQLAKLVDQEKDLHARLAEHAADYERLARLDRELRDLVARREALEEEWLLAAAVLE
jgi:ATP-binding cassette subfamily F protein uup